MIKNKWSNKLFRRTYFACAKRKERGTTPEDFDCLTYATERYEALLEKQKKEYEKRPQDPTFLYLKSILTQDRKREEQAQRTERYINVDKTNITTRKKKRNETADLW